MHVDVSDIRRFCAPVTHPPNVIEADTDDFQKLMSRHECVIRSSLGLCPSDAGTACIAGMESGKFPPDTKLRTTSCITYGSSCFWDHNNVGFGTIGYADALRFSSNTFFYQVGVGVGSRAMKTAADALGFQQKTGIEFSWEENIGLVGDADWAAKGRDFFEPGTTPWIPEDTG